MRGIDGNQALRRIFAVYVVLVVVRVAFSAVTWLLGNKAYAMLIPRSDFFADSIKSGLAQTSISHRLESSSSQAMRRSQFFAGKS
ncbi:MAG: hypothetical protein EON58_20615, partial [Alphaproteobacteria bacterium]